MLYPASLLSPDEHGHLKIYLPKKLLECLPKCSSLPKERHRWNTNEVREALLDTSPLHRSVGWTDFMANDEHCSKVPVRASLSQSRQSYTGHKFVHPFLSLR